MEDFEDLCAARYKLVAALNLDRVAMLCDQLLRLNVPKPAVQPIVDWLNDNRPSGARKIEL